MDDALITKIKKSMEPYTTQELLEIWENNDRNEYSDEFFEAARLTLMDRNTPLPQQREFIDDEVGDNIIRVGHKEKHKIYLYISKSLGASVRLEGRKIKGKESFLGDSMWEFAVGKDEIHNVTIYYKEDESVFALLDNRTVNYNKFSVYVDDKLVHGPGEPYLVRGVDDLIIKPSIVERVVAASLFVVTIITVFQMAKRHVTILLSGNFQSYGEVGASFWMLLGSVVGTIIVYRLTILNHYKSYTLRHIIGKLKEPHRASKAWAMRRLEKIADQFVVATINPLIDIVSDKDKTLRKTAVSLLRRMTKLIFNSCKKDVLRY